MASPQAVTHLLHYFRELYPTREFSDFTLDAWCAALDDLTDEQIAEAGRRIVKESGRTFFPTPNEVRDQVPRPSILTLANPDDAVARSIEQQYAERAKTSKRIPYPGAA